MALAAMPFVAYTSRRLASDLPWAIYAAAVIAWLGALAVVGAVVSRLRDGIWTDPAKPGLLALAAPLLVGQFVAVTGSLIVFASLGESAQRLTIVAMGYAAVLSVVIPVIVWSARTQERVMREVRVRFVRRPQRETIAALRAALHASRIPFAFNARAPFLGTYPGAVFTFAEGSARLFVQRIAFRASAVYKFVPAGLPSEEIERCIGGALGALDAGGT